MNTQNNLDQTFRDKLHDLEANPDAIVWSNIAQQLQQKKQKRSVLPFWWIAASVAVITFGVFVANNAIVNPTKTTNSVVNTQDKTINKPKKQINDSSKSNNKTNQVDYAVDNNTEQKIQKNAPIINTNNSKLAKNKNNNQLKNLNNSQRSIANQSEEINAIAQDKGIQTQNTIEFQIDNNQNTTQLQLAKTENISDKKTEIVKQETITKVDEKNLLAELETEKGNKIKSKPKSDKKWSLGTLLAIVNFNNRNNNSNIDASLNTNAKNYQNTISYGFGVQYQLNTKIAFRSAISSLTSNQTTNNISFVQSVQTGNTFLVSIPNGTIGTTTVVIPPSGGTLSGDFTNSFLVQNPQTGNIRETLNYLEIPIEISYKIIDQKIGVSLISGISTLVLNKNQVTIQNSTSKIDFGNLSNTNAFNFSTNLGLGFNHNLTQNISLNLDGMLKYQLNTFKTQSNNPYTFGVYTGINYKF